MTESEYEAEIARLKRENTKLFSQFAACSIAFKRLNFRYGQMEAKGDQLQYELTKTGQQAAA